MREKIMFKTRFLEASVFIFGIFDELVYLHESGLSKATGALKVIYRLLVVKTYSHVRVKKRFSLVRYETLKTPG